MQVHFNFIVDLAAVVITVMLLPMLLVLLCWVLESIGMHNIAKRRGIHHAWLSWIPLGNMWILGSISDQYRYVARGEQRSRRKVLLAFSIVNTVLSCILIGGILFVLFQVFRYSGGHAYYGSHMDYLPESEMLRQVIAPLIFSIGMAVILSVCLVLQLVFTYMALSDLFRSCTPENHALFLVLSILIPVTLAFFVFACRKRDNGMPPRREIPQQPPAEPRRAPVEPWEDHS